MEDLQYKIDLKSVPLFFLDHGTVYRWYNGDLTSKISPHGSSGVAGGRSCNARIVRRWILGSPRVPSELSQNPPPNEDGFFTGWWLIWKVIRAKKPPINWSTMAWGIWAHGMRLDNFWGIWHALGSTNGPKGWLFWVWNHRCWKSSYTFKRYPNCPKAMGRRILGKHTFGNSTELNHTQCYFDHGFGP